MTSASQTQHETRSWLRILWQRGWLKGLLLAAAVVFAYQPAWRAGFIWDDDAYVTHNPLLTAPDGLKRIWFSLDSPSQYFPLTYTTFRLEHALWGLQPAGYHWVNILLHALNALLVWRVLKRLGVPGAWLAAGLFALHPVQVESVAWITERKNLLSLFFCLLSVRAWIEFVEDRPWPWWRYYFLSLICFWLALCSKTTACTLPAALLLVLWLQRKPIDRFWLAQVVPFLVTGVGMGLVTVWWERYHQGTQGALFSLGFPERILMASRAVWFYLGKLVWPVNLAFSYPRWTINPGNPFAYVWLVAGAGLGAAIYFARRYTGRGVEVAALFYVATLSPLLGFIMLYTFRYASVADHYQYVASIGPLALAAAGMTRAAGFFGKRNSFLAPALGGTLLLVLGVLTWRQSRMYTDQETLWRTTIARNPVSFLGYNNLGDILDQRNEVDGAIALYQKALEAKPDYADAEYNLGLALSQKGWMDDAMVHYEKALAIQPDLAKANYNLGNVLFGKGRLDEAITHYQRALEIQPDHVKACSNLGLALLQKGRTDEAIVYFKKALALQPGFAEVCFNLGNLYLQKGRVDEAITYFQKALEIKPDFAGAYNNLCHITWVLATAPSASIRNGAKAVALAEQLNRHSGGKDPQVIGILAAAYAESGRFPEAITTVQQALQLATAQNNNALSAALQTQLQNYQNGSPLRDAGHR